MGNKPVYVWFNGITIVLFAVIGDKQLSEPVMVNLLTHICVTKPQWVNNMNMYSTNISMRWIVFDSTIYFCDNHTDTLRCYEMSVISNDVIRPLDNDKDKIEKSLCNYLFKIVPAYGQAPPLGARPFRLVS